MHLPPAHLGVGSHEGEAAFLLGGDRVAAGEVPVIRVVPQAAVVRADRGALLGAAFDRLLQEDPVGHLAHRSLLGYGLIGVSSRRYSGCGATGPVLIREPLSSKRCRRRPSISTTHRTRGPMSRAPASVPGPAPHAATIGRCSNGFSA